MTQPAQRGRRTGIPPTLDTRTIDGVAMESHLHPCIHDQTVWLPNFGLKAREPAPPAGLGRPRFTRQTMPTCCESAKIGRL